MTKPITAIGITILVDFQGHGGHGLNEYTGTGWVHLISLDPTTFKVDGSGDVFAKFAAVG